MTNEFSKEERVAFEDICQGFEDQLVLSRNVSEYQNGDTEMERSGDIIWRPMPYISQSFDGMDQTGNFKTNTQLSVPATIGFERSVPWQMDAKELRDALQQNRLGEAAKTKLASDINVAIMNTAANQGTIVVKRVGAATGYDDMAQCDSAFNEVGIVATDRCAALSSRDYNNMAGNLAERPMDAKKTRDAYERSSVGMISSFDTFKLDYANRLTAAAGAGITINTTVAGGNYYTPVSVSTAATGEKSNVDNRYQTVTFSSTTNVKAGDAFTIAGSEAVHHITKESTGQLKTHRVISVQSGATAVISPPIISNQGGTDPEAQYQNVEVTPSATAAVVWLNTATARVNPIWHKDALEILPGRYAVPTDAGAAVMRSTSSTGIDLVMTKFFDINTLKTQFRVDCLFGVVNKQPEMSGIMLFDQV